MDSSVERIEKLYASLQETKAKHFGVSSFYLSRPILHLNTSIPFFAPKKAVFSKGILSVE